MHSRWPQQLIRLRSRTTRDDPAGRRLVKAHVARCGAGACERPRREREGAGPTGPLSAICVETAVSEVACSCPAQGPSDVSRQLIPSR